MNQYADKGHRLIPQSWNKNGTIAKDNEKVFASFDSGKEKNIYKVLTYNNYIYDPLGTDSSRENTLNTKLKTVSSEVHQSYVAYLATKNKTHFLRAQRLYNNG